MIVIAPCSRTGAAFTTSMDNNYYYSENGQLDTIVLSSHAAMLWFGPRATCSASDDADAERVSQDVHKRRAGMVSINAA